MNTIPQDQIISIDVSRDWLDIHCLPEGQYARIPNTDAGHQGLTELARRSGAIVCFEATGGQEWRLWAVLDAAGVEARQLPPAQIKAFATSRGTRAKTGRIDHCPAVHRAAMSREGPNSLPAFLLSGRMQDVTRLHKNSVLSEP